MFYIFTQLFFFLNKKMIPITGQISNRVLNDNQKCHMTNTIYILQFKMLQFKVLKYKYSHLFFPCTWVDSPNPLSFSFLLHAVD